MSAVEKRRLAHAMRNAYVSGRARLQEIAGRGSRAHGLLITTPTREQPIRDSGPPRRI